MTLFTAIRTLGLVSGLRYVLGTAVEGRDYTEEHEIIHVDNSYDSTGKTPQELDAERKVDSIDYTEELQDRYDDILDDLDSEDLDYIEKLINEPTLEEKLAEAVLELNQYIMDAGLYTEENAVTLDQYHYLAHKALGTLEDCQ